VDFCAVDVRDLHGNLKRIAIRHAEPTLDRRANEMTDVRPPRDPAATLRLDERDALALSDVRVYELSAGRQFVGHLTVGMAGSDRRFDASSERILEELGRRAGLAFANALLYQEAQDANRLKDEFLGVVSHELRTPLNAIMGWTRLAGASREAGINSQQALDAIDRNARALARLVDDLLDVPRIMMGKLALDVRPVDLVSILQSAVDAIRPLASSKSLDVHMQAHLPAASVPGDLHRLEQVFGNILSNAVKFTPNGGRIIVSLRREADSYVIAFEDTGVGINKEFLPFVFDRFRQADSSTTRAHGGLGIGLSIVRHLVEMHGGHVTAASAGPGRGSVFTVTFPVTYADPAAMIPDDSGSATDAVVARLKGMRLLLLDDEADSRDVVARLLEVHGAVVRPTASVDDAMHLLNGAPGEFDAVLADIGMPERDGFDFVASLRAAADARIRTLPVIAVTAYVSRTDRSRALAASFDAHVAKPVSVVALAEAIGEAIAARAAR
jgi:signal transduction histidine kinase/ActR/RegA family two-component response regulator